MIRTSLLVILCVVAFSPAYCQHKQDSISLTAFIRQAYRWHNLQITEDKAFEPRKAKPQDTIYSGIDFKAVDFMVKKLRNSGFFDELFLVNYRRIAMRMDQELKDGTATWREGDLPPFNHNADPWCDCADVPRPYWNKIIVSAISYSSGEISLKWTRGDHIFHVVKVKKEQTGWKITYLDGYDQSHFHWAGKHF